MLIAVKMEMRRTEEPVMYRRNVCVFAGSLLKGEKRLAKAETGEGGREKGQNPIDCSMETSEK